MSAFQVVLLSIFGVIIVAAVLLFASGGLGQHAAPVPDLTMWGTLKAEDINNLLAALDNIKRGAIKVTYVQKDPASFDAEFTEAVAEGKGPDIIVLSQDEILSERNKLIPIPLTTLTDRQIADTFVEEGSIFGTSRGYLAVPFTIDPLVMYWNRTLFQNAGLSRPPQYWDELSTLVPTLTKKDQSSNITQSTIALGEIVNINNAKAILSSLIFQAGNPITVLSPATDPHPDQVSAVLDQKFSATVPPTPAALDFYTEFSDPTNPNFSWTRALPNSSNDFLAGKLAIYLGFASEYASLREKNPNLNFDVALLPQPRNATARINFGNITGLAIAKGTQHSDAAYAAIGVLTNSTSLSILSGMNNLPPVRRDLLATTATSAAMAVFQNAALQSKGWFDPNPNESVKVFREMVESIESGNRTTGDAVSAGNVELQNLIP
ncbi:MAG TPA: extracellular solute-binding protein [Candidatus Paceibacterota bacterium]|nr:extracellular solute-binding protein [Candidatus Paceibacterota bacterium]